MKIELYLFLYERIKYPDWDETRAVVICAENPVEADKYLKNEIDEDIDQYSKSVIG